MRFSKYEGLGNDFVIVDAADAADITTERAVELCDRHLGVGADGVLIVTGGDRPAMRVINADGSTAEMCGNGIRCVALYLTQAGAGPELTIDTEAGLHRCRVLGDGRVEVTMRQAALSPADVPVRSAVPLVDTAILVSGRPVHLTAVSMGNPHAVTFDDVGDARLSLGPAIGGHVLFPEGANAGFATVGPTAIELHVYERGAGWTRACGTGACAAAAAAVETGRARRGEPVNVNLPGGALTIVVQGPDEPVLMTGPARHVFDGTLG